MFSGNYTTEPWDERVDVSLGVKVTHVPTGMYETCSEEKSQVANRQIAYARLYERVKNASRST